MSLRDRFTREKIKKVLKKWGMFFLNPHLLLCLFLGWMITNGWSYLALGIGLAFHIKWLQIVATAYLSMLWLPFTPEKILTVLIAIFLLGRLFPKDEKTLGILRQEYHEIKESMRRQKEERRAKKEARAKRKSDAAEAKLQKKSAKKATKTSSEKVPPKE